MVLTTNSDFPPPPNIINRLIYAAKAQDSCEVRNNFVYIFRRNSVLNELITFLHSTVTSRNLCRNLFLCTTTFRTDFAHGHSASQCVSHLTSAIATHETTGLSECNNKRPVVRSSGTQRIGLVSPRGSYSRFIWTILKGNCNV
jgi:hypothetical protein